MTTAKLDDIKVPSPTNKKTNEVKKNLEQVLLTQQELAQIKENLSKMIDAMAHNPSLLSRAATYWGELPLWQKIVAGIALIVPAFVVAFITQVAVLFSISIFMLFTYTASSILLDNHHTQNINRTENLKTGISGLADTLGVVILSLDKLREQIATEIEHFQKENERLALHTNELSDQIEQLTTQSEQLRLTEQALRKTHSELETQAESLNVSVKEHTELLQTTKEELKKVQLGYEKSQTNLTEKISELNTVKIEMSSEIEKGKGLAATLQAAVLSLSNTVILDGEQQKVFKEKLDLFLNNKEASFHLIAERICNAEAELSIVKDELARSNERYHELLNRGEAQVLRLEQLKSTPAQTPKTSPATAMKNIGLYAVDSKTTPLLIDPNLLINKDMGVCC